MKVCAKCKEIKQLTDFGKNKPRKDGLNTRCKKCACLEATAYANSNKEKVKAQHAIYRSKNTEKIRANRASFYLKNSQIEKVRATQWNLENKDRYKINLDAWRLKNQEKIKTASLKWRDKNKIQIAHSSSLRRISKRDLYFASAAKWRRANLDKLRIYNQNRRARLLSSGVLTVNLAQNLLKLQRGKCACCKKRLDVGYHLGHRMPLALGGANIDSNIQLLCQFCNLSKHKRHPVDFMQSRGFLL